MSVRCRQCGKFGVNVSAGFEVEFRREMPWTVIRYSRLVSTLASASRVVHLRQPADVPAAARVGEAAVAIHVWRPASAATAASDAYVVATNVST